MLQPHGLPEPPAGRRWVRTGSAEGPCPQRCHSTPGEQSPPGTAPCPLPPPHAAAGEVPPRLAKLPEVQPLCKQLGFGSRAICGQRNASWGRLGSCRPPPGCPRPTQAGAGYEVAQGKHSRDVLGRCHRRGRRHHRPQRQPWAATRGAVLQARSCFLLTDTSWRLPCWRAFVGEQKCGSNPAFNAQA